MNNLLSLTGVPCSPGDEEFFQTLLQGGDGLRIERIVSHGHVTRPDDYWYDQEQDEWVLILEGNARLLFENGDEAALGRGDHILLPARHKHRVIYTSSPCIWLAVFANRLR